MKKEQLSNTEYYNKLKQHKPTPVRQIPRQRKKMGNVPTRELESNPRPSVLRADTPTDLIVCVYKKSVMEEEKNKNNNVLQMIIL